MEKITTVRDFEILKIIGDSRRLNILRHLMVKPATLSQLGGWLSMHPAKVRHHLKLLERIGLVEFVSSREVRGFVEKYYQATAEAYYINHVILPNTDNAQAVVVLGSHDPALDSLSAYFERKKKSPRVITVPVGSLDGLVALRQRLCHMAGCHLFDPIAKEYNLSYVRHFFPDLPVHVLTVAHRLQGLFVQPGNPDVVRGIEDLAREDLIFINRKQGSGTRIWLDQELERNKIDPQKIRGYENVVNTHSLVAEAILSGTAQVGLGVMAAAQKCGLGFIPLFKERFDLVILDEAFQSNLLSPVLDYIQTARYRDMIEALGGYDPNETGKLIRI